MNLKQFSFCLVQRIIIYPCRPKIWTPVKKTQLLCFHFHVHSDIIITHTNESFYNLLIFYLIQSHFLKGPIKLYLTKMSVLRNYLDFCHRRLHECRVICALVVLVCLDEHIETMFNIFL